MLDSGSTDRTVEIAKAKGAHVWTNPFESFGTAQRNWAIDNIPMKHDWVFHLDADKRFTPELVEAMRDLLNANPRNAGFHVPQKLMFMGQWLKRSAAYPTYQMRLFHRKRMATCDYGHGQRELTDGAVGTLDEPYIHFSFAKGLYDWLDKHNRYSSLEALQVITSSRESWKTAELFSGDKVRRRRPWKEFGYILPLRPRLRWFVTLFVLGGILEGRAGQAYAQLIALYEEMITLKLRLLRSRRYETAAFPLRKHRKPVARTSIFNAEDQFIDSGPASTAAAAATSSHSPSPVLAPKIAPMQNGHALDAAALQSAEQALQMRPESSPWTFREKLGRAVWMVFGKPIFRISFHNWYPFRAWWLRMFEHKIGRGVAIRPTANIEVPWMLEMQDDATVGDHAILYSLGRITIGKRSIISQYAYSRGHA